MFPAKAFAKACGVSQLSLLITPPGLQPLQACGQWLVQQLVTQVPVAPLKPFCSGLPGAM